MDYQQIIHPGLQGRRRGHESGAAGIDCLVSLSWQLYIALKSASLQAFFCCAATQLRFSKAQLRSLCFTILGAILIATFMILFGMENLNALALIAWWLTPALRNLLPQV
jgi:hypothetical protein